MSFDADHDPDDESPGLAAGYGPQDVDVLEELVSLSMQVARDIARNVRIRTERAEQDPKAEPLSEAEGTRAHLALVRLSRNVRILLVLKAHVLGAPENPVRLVRGAGRAGAPGPGDDDDGSITFFPPCPVNEPGYPSFDDREEIADFCDDEVRFGLEHAITHPDRDAAEVERMRERVECWLECEYSPYGSTEFIQQIARDLGLGDRVVMGFGPDGRDRGWMIARPEDAGPPVTVPEGLPWPERRIRRKRGPIPITPFLQIPGRKEPPPPFRSVSPPPPGEGHKRAAPRTARADSS